jgi:DNA (cytosine-5)-methyltransferase 1
LGKDNLLIHSLIKERLGKTKTWVLIGGPPCQAYSLVGRSRMQNHDGLKADHRHFLYKEYLAIIEKFEPAIFVMENVKGLNTAKVAGKPILPAILKDLRDAGSKGYELHSLEAEEGALPGMGSDDFLIKAERHGVPQTRHRVIIVGVRKDLKVTPEPLLARKPVTVAEAIGDLPSLKGLDSGEERKDYSSKQKGQPMTHAKGLRESLPNSLFAFLSPLSSQLDEVLLNHQARSHMKEDLERYAWWAAEAKKTGKSPTLHDNVPKALLPKHQNVHDDSPMVFADRFKVQLADKPSGTVTSHISKDGHYYIHYDPAQARSFSVREAARIQTFPDDYFFMGNRTQQYHQVGNAVPPYLAYQIGIRIAGALGLLAR